MPGLSRVGRGTSRKPVVVDGHERETVGVIEVTLLDREEEQDDGAAHEEEAHEHLHDQDLHGAFLRARSESCVAKIVDSELAGMSTAHSSGVMSPASASETVTAL